MKPKITFILTLFILIIVSCTDRDKNEVEAELEVYFDDFVNEAELRGVELDLTTLDISGYVENIQDRGVLGQCKSYSDGSKEVVVDENYWNRIGPLDKEYLVFHELGHCLLNREHTNTKDASGFCTSIMQSGGGVCRELYNDSVREELLDELFEK